MNFINKQINSVMVVVFFALIATVSIKDDGKLPLLLLGVLGCPLVISTGTILFI